MNVNNRILHFPAVYDSYWPYMIRQKTVVIRSHVLRQNTVVYGRIVNVYGRLRPYTELITVDLGERESRKIPWEKQERGLQGKISRTINNKNGRAMNKKRTRTMFWTKNRNTWLSHVFIEDDDHVLNLEMMKYTTDGLAVTHQLSWL
jgi:hypothetical protein